ncbi:MAG: hypothetical protein NT023_03455 [Armatimonadetes bacterium]|nr:hypothetical protein [Armatimonadota bacterium]
MPADNSNTTTRISLINLGCAKNEVDSEEMLGVLENEGYSVSASWDVPGVRSDTDVVVINTCGFIDSARKQSMDTIREALKRKEKGEIKKVVVAGCLAQRYSKELPQELTGVDAFIGTGEVGTTAG